MADTASDWIERSRSGDAAATVALDQALYAQLKGIAEGHVGRNPAHSLSATALVHEAVLRLLGSGRTPESRAHLLALGALKMQAVLVDHARRRQADKRGGGLAAITLGAAGEVSVGDAQAFLDLQVAIEALEREDERAARAVVHSYFGGMNAEESALALQVSVATVERDLAFGRAFLRRRLGS